MSKVIELTEVTFASSIRIGKDNLEKSSIDTNLGRDGKLIRGEDRYYQLFYHVDEGLIYIIDLNPALADPSLAHKRKRIVGLPNIRCMTPKVIPQEIKDAVNENYNKEKKKNKENKENKEQSEK